MSTSPSPQPSAFEGEGVRSQDDQAEASLSPQPSAFEGEGVRSQDDQAEASPSPQPSRFEGEGVRSRDEQAEATPPPQSSAFEGEGVRPQEGQVQASPSPQPSPFEGEGVRLGEVVQASTSEFTTQCHRLYEAPPLGALVRSGGAERIYGVVAEVSTQGVDPGRRPIAMGEDAETEEAVYERNPQLSRLLATEFRSMVVGHQADGRLYRYLAPLPPRIHAFVYRCGGEEVREFSESLDFIAILLSTPLGSRDDVVASFIRHASTAHPEPGTFLVDAGKELATLMGGQLQRLNSLLRRLAP